MRKLNTHYLLLTASTVIAALTLIFAGGFTVIGHRGEYFSNRYGTVEHTFRSYDNALTDGADWLEIDLEQSSDGVLVISHDPTTNRLSGVNHVISQTPWSTLSQLPLGNSGEKIHSLEELFQHYRNDQRAKFVIETRRVNGQLTQERELLQLVAKYGMQHRVYYESLRGPVAAIDS
jgi:glycerophosphoryl diester phosphodiesterase